MLEDDQQSKRARARELSLGAMLEQTARMRVERVLKAKSRVFGQQKDPNNGDVGRPLPRTAEHRHGRLARTRQGGGLYPSDHR